MGYLSDNDDGQEQPEEEYDETLQNLQKLRVKLFRLARRLGQTPGHSVVAQVLNKIWIAEQLNTTKGVFCSALTFNRATTMAERLESPPGQHEPLDLSCTILVIGISGSGKTSTLNSIFDKPVFATNAFGPGTSKIQDHIGTLHGINVRVIDTPGLSLSDHRQNEKTLSSVKSFLKKMPPDVILYVDRLDTRGGELGDDKALMGTITSVFGPSFWKNVVVVFTHAASAPPENDMGMQIVYNHYLAHRKKIAQETIRDASGDMWLTNLFSLVENHSGCRTNMDGQPVLPNGQVWKHELLLSCFALTIQAVANITLPLIRGPAPRRGLLHLPSLLSSFLQPRPQAEIPTEQFGSVVVDDDDLEYSGSDSDSEEDEYEYDKLPPFKRLTKRELEKLSRSQRNAYYDEIEYREMLFMRKELKEKKRKLRREEMRETQEETESQNDEENNNPNPWIVEPVYNPMDWDQGTGIVGAQVEKVFVLKEKIPIFVLGQVWRGANKKNNLQMEITSSIKHGKGKSTSLGFVIQPWGNNGDYDMAYTVRGETLFSNHGTNKASAGVTATLVGGDLSGGVKLVDKLSIGRWVRLQGSAGANCGGGSGDAAYGGGLEVRVKDRDNPLGRFLTTIGLDVLEGHGEVGLGGHAVVQVPIGRRDHMVARINVDKGGFGKLGFSVGGSDQVQIPLLFLIPLVKKLLFSVGLAWV